MKKTFMKKIFIILFILAFSVFYMRFVLSAPLIDGHDIEDICEGQIDDMDGRCLGEYEISRREAINMNNVKNIAKSFNSIATDVVPNFKYLSSPVKEKLTEKFNDYYNKNNDISTTTIQSIPRSQRDLFFKDAYTPYISLLKTRSIFSTYNELGSSIQDIVTLLNSTVLYIQNSAINTAQFQTDIQTAKAQLNSYIDQINSDISNLNTTISSFNKDNPDSFAGFIDSSVQSKTILNDSKTVYYSVKDDIVSLTVDAIRAVEIAYNGNSSIVASPNIIYSDGVSVSKVTVTVKNTLNNPITNRQVNLTTTNSGIVISPESVYTNASGVAEFSITSTKDGYISLKATIADETLELSGTNIINVISLANKGCIETGGTWTGETCICKEGYTWIEKDLKCISLAQIGCESTGGTWSGKICTCPKGYTWIEKDLKCISLAQIGCESTGGTWIGIGGGGIVVGACNCNEGYTWVEAELKCISLAQIGCESSGGTWTGSTCSCPTGYTWSVSKLQCITLAQSGCESSGGTWTGSTCSCPSGYTWDNNNLKCVLSGGSTTPEDACNKEGGVWDKENNTCICSKELVWDEKELKCVESSGITEEVCKNGGGEWDGKSCICPDETIWDEKELKCIKK